VDEPTTGLDAEVRRTLWATLRTLAAAGRGVVLTTHYLEEADALADRIVLLHEGRVIAEGTPSQIKSLVPGRRITAESSIEAGQASGWAGVQHAQRDGTRLELLVSEPEPVLRELLHRDQSVTGVTVTEPTLEDAFLTLTDRTKEAA
jgi:ABC-2 type transport system ATP-binding protein